MAVSYRLSGISQKSKGSLAAQDSIQSGVVYRNRNTATIRQIDECGSLEVLCCFVGCFF